MAVGKVLPVAGQLIAERQQLRLLQLADTLKDLAFRVGAFQRQVEVVQQAAEQPTVK